MGIDTMKSLIDSQLSLHMADSSQINKEPISYRRTLAFFSHRSFTTFHARNARPFALVSFS